MSLQRKPKRPNRAEAGRLLDIALTRVEQAKAKVKVQNDLQNTPEYLELRKTLVDYRNAQAVYRAAGGDRAYAGTILMKEEEQGG